MATCSLVMETLTEWDMWIMSTYGQGVNSGACTLFICSLLGSVVECFNQLSNIICYSGKYRKQYGCGLDGAIWPCSNSGPVIHILFCVWVQALSEVTVSEETVRCFDISSFPCSQTHSGCSGFLFSSQEWTSAFKSLALLSHMHPFGCPSKECLWKQMPLSFIFQLLQDMYFLLFCL